MKKIIAIVVAIGILIITLIIREVTDSIALNVISQDNSLSEGIVLIINFLGKLFPLFIGIWLVRLSWKKITYEEPKKGL